MATKRSANNTPRKSQDGAATTTQSAGSSIEELLLAAQARGSENMETGRFLVTFKEGALDEGIKGLKTQSMRTADARDFADQHVAMDALGDADAVIFPEVGVALIGAPAAQARGMHDMSVEMASDSAVQIIEPEYFVFAEGAQDYLRGFLRAAEVISRDIGGADGAGLLLRDDEMQAQVLGATWGLTACRVPPSVRSGLGIKVAVLDTGMDLGHPDFVGRSVVSATFVGQPVQDLQSHGTHCIGTSCGPLAPAGTTPRYGIAYRAAIYVGKVLANTGSSVGGSVWRA